MNSEALLNDDRLQHLAEQKVLIIRGVGGREYLAEQLTVRGAQVDYLECYQRALVDRPVGEVAALIESHSINSVCINSGESLGNFCTLAAVDTKPKIKKLLLVVPGERVALLAKAQGFENITVAENASDPSMLAALALAVLTIT